MVIVDPGHGGKDPGAVNLGLYEKDINLFVSAAVTQNLRSRYTMTRYTDEYLSLRQRVEIARPEDFFLSVHCNAGGGTGSEIWVYPGSEARRFAETLGPLFRSYSVTQPFRGIKESSRLYVLRRTPCPAALVELAFIDSPRDSALLVQREVQQRLGELLALAADAFLESR